MFSTFSKNVEKNSSSMRIAVYNSEKRAYANGWLIRSLLILLQNFDTKYGRELLLLPAVIISKFLYTDSCYSTLCHDKSRKLLRLDIMQHEPYTTPCPFLPDIAIWRLQVNAQGTSLLCASPEQAINYHLRRNRFHGSPISQGACL